jgi:hypothetical protein
LAVRGVTADIEAFRERIDGEALGSPAENV